MEQTVQKGLSRRQFLIGSGAAATIAAVAGCRWPAPGDGNLPLGMEWLPFDAVSIASDGTVDVGISARRIFTEISTRSPMNPANLSGGAHTPFQIRSDGPNPDWSRHIIGSMSPTGRKLDLSTMTIIRVDGPSVSALAWSKAGNGWAATIPPGADPRAVLNQSSQDEFGRPVPLRMGDGPAPGRWHFNQKTRMLSVDRASLEALDIVYYQPGTSPMRVFGSEVYFENILFLGVMPWVFNFGGRTAKAVFKNCAFWYSPNAGAANEGGYVVMDGCEIYRCRDDGLGSHRLGVEEARHVAINTKVRYAGDFDTYGAGSSNQNGFSMHESGLAAILGCDIQKSCGPNLVDTGSGPGSAGVSWWYGVHCQDSLGSNPTNFESYGVRTVWMEHCTEAPSDKVTVRVDGEGTVLHYSRNKVSGYTAQNGALAMPAA